MSHPVYYNPVFTKMNIKFLPRDGYAYRGLCRGKMFVRPSVTRRYSVETGKHIINDFFTIG